MNNILRTRRGCLLVHVAALLFAGPCMADSVTAPEVPVPEDPAPRSRVPGGVTLLKGQEGQAALKLGMSLQTDLRVPLSDSGLESSFLVRRARLVLSGTLAPFADTRLIADFGQRDTPLFQDAWIDLRATSWLRLRVGRLKVPVGYEWLETSSNHLDFVEQSLVFSLVLPRYDQGLALHGDLWGGHGEYWLGLFNEASSKARDEDSGKMLAGRLSVSPVEGVSMAVSGTRGLGDNLPEEVRTRLPTGYGFLTASPYTVKYAEGTSGLYVAPPDWRLGAEVISFLGPTSLKMEYAAFHAPAREGWLRAVDIDREDKRVRLPGLRSQAVYASGTLVLTGERRAERGVDPSQPFNPAAGQFGAGAWELGLRYGFAQLDFESLPGLAEQGGASRERIHELTAGVNWYLNRSTRWMFNFSRYAFSGSQPSFQELLMRVQWMF